MRIRLLIALLFLVQCSPAGLFRRGAEQGDSRKQISVHGTTRTYLLHLPASLQSGHPAPLVLMFHGGDGRAAPMPRFTGFDELADAKGFIVVYPDGLDRHWNDGRGLSKADDVGFVRALIDELEGEHLVDPKRIYATGISNGGFFSNRLACELSDKIAAIASVAATMPEVLMPACKPSRPVSVMYMQGTKDPLVPINGGTIGPQHGTAVSLQQAEEFWRVHDQTSPKPVSEDLPELVKDGTKVHRDVYGNGKDHTEVVVYTIDGGGHTWPGGTQYLPIFVVGKVTRNLQATPVIWEFFQKHSLP